MRVIELEELKQIQFDILQEIHNFCIANGINYSLAYGTLLGAIRHKGYIPWDDDIDIMMFRPDYDRFLKLFPGCNEHLEICAPEIDLNYYAPYANVWDNRTVLEEGSKGAASRGFGLGIKVDVFPIDKTSDKEAFKYWTRFLHLLWCSYRFDERAFKGIYKIKSMIINLISHCIGYKNIQRIIRWNALRNSSRPMKKVDLLVFYTNWNREFSISDFDSFTEVVFEGRKFSAISGYDDYLKCAFGDYMQLPPEKDRIPHHFFKAYWKD